MFTIFVVVVAAAVFVMYVRNERQRPLRLREAPARPIAELSEETPGRIVGITQVAGELLTAPLSGRPCVYYAAQFERLHTPDAVGPLVPGGAEAANRDAARADPAGTWVMIASETHSVSFLIQDETGRAFIEPTAAKVEITGAVVMELDPAELTLRHREFLTRHQVAEAGARLRCSEAVIAIGEAIAVVGAGIREPDPDAAPATDYRGDPPTRLRLTSSPKRPLFISNDW